MKVFVQIRFYIFVVLLVTVSFAPARSQNPTGNDFVQVPNAIHNAGKKLLETERYVAYRHHPYYQFQDPRIDSFCESASTYDKSIVARIGLVFFTVRLNGCRRSSSYRNLFR